MSSVDRVPAERLPATVSWPAVPTPPGARVPRLLKVPVATSTVPEPLISPLLLIPPVLRSVALAATFKVPFCAATPPVRSSVPATTLREPLEKLLLK